MANILINGLRVKGVDVKEKDVTIQSLWSTCGSLSEDMDASVIEEEKSEQEVECLKADGSVDDEDACKTNQQERLRKALVIGLMVLFFAMFVFIVFYGYEILSVPTSLGKRAGGSSGGKWKKARDTEKP
jgi:hypothetical protein